MSETKKNSCFEEISGLFNNFLEGCKKNPAAVALGKLGGASKSEAKRKASAENGKKGGRPRLPKENNI